MNEKQIKFRDACSGVKCKTHTCDALRRSFGYVDTAEFRYIERLAHELLADPMPREGLRAKLDAAIDGNLDCYCWVCDACSNPARKCLAEASRTRAMDAAWSVVEAILDGAIR